MSFVAQSNKVFKSNLSTTTQNSLFQRAAKQAKQTLAVSMFLYSKGATSEQQCLQKKTTVYLQQSRVGMRQEKARLRYSDVESCFQKTCKVDLHNNDSDAA